MIGDAPYNDSANGPKHLQHLGSRSSQLDWCDLAAVCRCVGNEDTPWNTLEKLGCKHDWKRVAKVEYQDKQIQEHEAGNGRPTVSDTAGKGTSQADADNCTDWPTHLQRRLPASHDDILVLRDVKHTVFLGECRQGDEIAHQEDTIGLHDLKMLLADILHRENSRCEGREAPHNSARHDKRPQSSHRVLLNSLKDPHVMLRVLCLDCSGLVLGEFRGLVEIRGIFDNGFLDVRIAAGRFELDRITHVC